LCTGLSTFGNTVNASTTSHISFVDEFLSLTFSDLLKHNTYIKLLLCLGIRQYRRHVCRALYVLDIHIIGDEWLVSSSGFIYSPGERSLGTHWLKGWVGPRITLDILMHREIIAITNVAILH
jgi:hypothetical protein